MSEAQKANPYELGWELNRDEGTVTVWQGLRSITLDESDLLTLLKAVQSL